LQKVGKAHGFPATQQSLSHRRVVFAALGVNKDPMAVKVQDVERIEAPVALDVPGALKIGLVDVVDVEGFAEIGIFHPLGRIRSFF